MGRGKSKNPTREARQLRELFEGALALKAGGVLSARRRMALMSLPTNPQLADWVLEDLGAVMEQDFSSLERLILIHRPAWDGTPMVQSAVAKLHRQQTPWGTWQDKVSQVERDLRSRLRYRLYSPNFDRSRWAS